VESDTARARGTERESWRAVAGRKGGDGAEDASRCVHRDLMYIAGLVYIPSTILRLNRARITSGHYLYTFAWFCYCRCSIFTRG
jgi:hypothetical protein